MTETHKTEIHLLEEIITDVYLPYFNPKKPLILEVDEFYVSLGAASLQDSKVIAYASKCFSSAEKIW